MDCLHVLTNSSPLLSSVNAPFAVNIRRYVCFVVSSRLLGKRR
jgi:hypothetical protein